MKNRKQKEFEYQEKYNEIPLNLDDRLMYMYDKFHITEAKAKEILDIKDRMLNSLYYKSINIILYEEPEGAQRPRTRIVNRQNLLNSAKANSEFVHIYSPLAAEDSIHMKRLLTDEDFIELEQLICTPCNVEYCTYLKTPSAWSKTDIFLAEIGLERPPVYPDWDNIGKKYSDMMNKNIWIDDALTIDGTVRKFYSILPRVEIKLLYMNMVYNKYQYDMITKRKDFTEDMNLLYFKKEK